jgi:RimJ/RimL family protein N-acetyltransferase
LFQKRGYATEATAAFIAWIFEHPHIRSVNAQTFPHLHGSVRVLMKNGFEFVGSGPGPEEGTVLYRKFRE